ncbi:MAG: HAD family hydrolase, partial [bacterium]
ARFSKKLKVLLTQIHELIRLNNLSQQASRILEKHSLVQAILFDYDGVLVNSMPFHVQAWQTVFREYDIEIRPEDVLVREGSRAIELATEVFAEHAIEISQDDLQAFVDRKQESYRSLANIWFEPVAESLLSTLKRNGFLLGLVTGSARRNVMFSANGQVLSLFDAIITNDETEKGKPNPECFLKAADALSVPPEQCLAIENAPLGIQAAKNAGMRVVALTTTLEKGNLAGADTYFKDLREFANSWEKIIFTKLSQLSRAS